MKIRPVALTIAATDPTGGAGVQSDLMTFHALGVYGLSAVTAVTAQNTQSFRAIHPVPPEILEAQLDAILEELPLAAFKAGALGGAEQVRVLADFADHVGPEIPFVLDPVILSSSGGRLLDEEGLKVLVELVLPRVDLLTPNLDEAGALLGRRPESLEDRRAAAVELLKMGPRGVLVKGGHGPEGKETVDVFCDAKGPRDFSSSRIEGGPVHGTGCLLSAAVTAQLALGAPLARAVDVGRSYVRRILRLTPADLGEGARLPDHG